MTIKKSDVVFVLVHYHAPEITLRALQSIDRHQSKYSFRSIIVDNGSTDSERSLLLNGMKQLNHTAELTARLSNPGYAGAINYAVRKTNTKFIAIVNNDAVVLKSWLDNLVGALLKDKNLGIVGGVEVDDEGVVHLPPRLVLKNLTTIVRKTASSLELVEFVSGSNMLIRRAYFQDWYESYFLYYEDVAACLNMWRSGHGVALIPSARVDHQANTTTASSIPIKRGIYANSNRYRLGYQFLAGRELSILWLNGLKGDLFGSLFWIATMPIVGIYNKARKNRDYVLRDKWDQYVGRLGGFIRAIFSVPVFIRERAAQYDKDWSLAQLLTKLHN